jgi:hypothetical protein
VRADGWFARVLQHEIDHLDGILFTDRIKPEDIREVTEEDIDASEGGAERPKAASKADGKAGGAGKTGAKSRVKSTAQPAAKSPTQVDGKTNGKAHGTTSMPARTTGRAVAAASSTGTAQSGVKQGGTK